MFERLKKGEQKEKKEKEQKEKRNEKKNIPNVRAIHSSNPIENPGCLGYSATRKSLDATRGTTSPFFAAISRWNTRGNIFIAFHVNSERW